MITLALAALVGSTYNWKFAPADGPLDNPLKGWCPFVTEATKLDVPYTMAYFNVTWKDLEPEEGKFAFSEWEKSKWELPGAKGKHIVFRLILDYPGDGLGVPDWVIKKGVKLTSYTDHGGGKTPDYNDPKLLEPLLKFIKVLGERYHGNYRVAFIQLGTLGHWGEWHTWPRTELFASPETQKKVIGAYLKAFPSTHLMARNPVDPVDKFTDLGYHDDMIPQDTQGPNDWEFLSAMRIAGLMDGWQTKPRGGEIVPAELKSYATDRLGTTMKAIEDAHFSWIGPACPPLVAQTAELKANQERMVRKMGYTFQLVSAKVNSVVGQVQIDLNGVNTGVAPFYYPWKVKYAFLDIKNNPVAVRDANLDIRKWLPGPFRATSALQAPPPGSYRLAIGIEDPYTNTPAITFANNLTVLDKWTVLGTVKVQ